MTRKMKLTIVRVPRMGLPSSGTPVTGVRACGSVLFSENDLAEERIDDAEGPVLLHPEDAVAHLTLSDGRRIEREVIAIAISGRAGRRAGRSDEATPEDRKSSKGGNDSSMGLHLMHVEHEPSNIVAPRRTYEALSDWISAAMARDTTLEAAVRAKPETGNLLHQILMHDDSAGTSFEATAVSEFAETVKRAAKCSDDQTMSGLAQELAERLSEFADRHQDVHLTLR